MRQTNLEEFILLCPKCGHSLWYFHREIGSVFELNIMCKKCNCIENIW